MATSCAISVAIRWCVEAFEIGPLHPGRLYACNSTLVSTSVIAWGRVRTVKDETTEIWFFGQLVEKYGDPTLFEPGNPFLDRIVLYKMTIELLTSKRSESLRH